MAPTLQTLPLELRLTIFETLGASTQLRIGFPNTSPPEEESQQQKEYAPRNRNPFAVLQTCRQISHEAELPLWHNIHLVFANTSSFIKTLASLSRESLQSIRFITFHGTNFQFDHSYPTYASIRWPEAICLFPGLQLARLTVFDVDTRDTETWCVIDKWDDIAFLEMDGMGWKELNFITKKVRLLIKEQFRGSFHTNKKGEKVYSAHQTWDAHIKKRDKDQSAGVKFYMVKKEFNGVEGAVLCPEKREEVLDRDEHVFEYFAEKDFWLIYESEWDKLPEREVMVTMRRGAKASYIGPEGHCGWFGRKCANFMEEHGWREILKAGWVKEAEISEFADDLSW